MQNDPKREWNDAQCEEFAAFDSAREPKEFLPQIYREATNGDQAPDARIAKTLAKCSALFIRLSDDQARASKRLERLTFGLILLTLALLIFTAYLYKDTHFLIQREQAATPHQVKNP